MKDKFKFRLKSGKIVEDAIFAYSQSAGSKKLSHAPTGSWILHLEADQEILARIFSEDELHEIHAKAIIPLPEVPSNVNGILEGLSSENFNGLNRSLAKLMLDNEERKDGDQHKIDESTVTWICKALHQWSYLNADKFLCRVEPSDRWWSINLWGYVIDNALQKIGRLGLSR